MQLLAFSKLIFSRIVVFACLLSIFFFFWKEDQQETATDLTVVHTDINNAERAWSPGSVAALHRPNVATEREVFMIIAALQY